jgi:hypothetical protein
MEEDAGGGLKYYLAVRVGYENDLARIRQWNNLKVGFEQQIIWIKDFDYAQIHSIEVRSLPFKTVYFEKGNRLYLLGHNLPERIVPSLLWTPIDRAVPITIPTLNHNFFGIDEAIQLKLVTREVESETIAMITTVDVMEQYIQYGPAIRLAQIRWILLDDKKIFLLGTPLLPIPGETYWSRKDLLIPTGFDFELFILADLIQKKVNPGREYWVLWNKANAYSLIPKEKIMPLSRSSFGLTFKEATKTIA